MSKQAETKFKEKVFDDLKGIKTAWFYKNVAGSVRGIPDVILCHDGHFYAFELKVDAPTTKLQEYNIKKINKANGTACVVTPNNWGMILQELKRKK